MCFDYGKFAKRHSSYFVGPYGEKGALQTRVTAVGESRAMDQWGCEG